MVNEWQTTRQWQFRAILGLFRQLKENSAFCKLLILLEDNSEVTEASFFAGRCKSFKINGLGIVAARLPPEFS